MVRKIVSGIVSILLLLSMLSLLSYIQPVRASGTIYIRADGSIDPPEAPISTTDNITYTLAGDISGSIVVQRDNIVVDGAGFTLSSGVSGVGIDARVDYVTIENMIISQIYRGILMDSSHSNVINDTFNNSNIRVDYSSYVNILNNTVTGSTWGQSPLLFYSCGVGNLVENNTMTYNNWAAIGAEYTGYAPQYGYGTSIAIRNNTLIGNGHGIFCYETYCLIIENNYIAYSNEGIGFGPMGGTYGYFTNHVARNNILVNNTFGIRFEIGETFNNTITNNVIANNTYGISTRLDGATTLYNKITNNTLVDNQIALEIRWSCDYNEIYHNNFIRNTVLFSGSLVGNFFDNGYPSGGNYWDDYSGTDIFKGPNQDFIGSDGFGDTPYIVESEWDVKDNYPLVQPYGLRDFHDIGIVDVVPSSLVVAQGTPLNITAGIFNYGSHSETFTVRFLANSTELETKTVTALAPGTEISVVSTRSTDGMELGNYTISATVDPVSGESYVEDNSYTDGNVTVRAPVRDIAVADIVPYRISVVQGNSAIVYVEGANLGEITETFDVSLYVNGTVVILPDGKNNTTVTLGSAESMIITLVWNTTGFTLGNYTLIAFAWPVPEETQIEDNTLSKGWISVTILGDINGDFKVSLSDLVLLANAYGSKLGDAKWNPNADINGNNIVDLSDLVLLANHYGQHYP